MGKVKKGLALVLANALYQTQPVLLSCNKDGLDMKAKLEQLDFDVLHYANTTRVATLEAIAEFIKLADLYSVLLVYYAGHGVQIDGKNYIVPIDCIYKPIKDVFISSSLVDVSTITNYMSMHEEKTNILIMDACRNSPSFLRSFGSTGLAEMTAGNGMIIAFATSPNTSALGSESPDGNGCYTKRLLEHIDHPNMKVEDMFKLVRKDVIKDTAGQQVPWENTSLNGNFYFCTMAQDEINEVIYQSIRNYHCAEMLINLSKRFGYTVSDVMRILFFSVIIWISSWHITRARMAAAMGSTTVSERLRSILKMPLFHACGVEPTSEAISPTLAFTLSNRPERLPVMPSIKMPFIHFSMISLIKQRYLLSRALPCERESAE